MTESFQVIDGLAPDISSVSAGNDDHNMTD